MISKLALLTVVSSLLAATNALGSFELSDPLKYEWYSNNTNFTSTWSKSFKITKHYYAGASAGATLAANMMRLDPDAADGFGLIIGTFKCVDFLDPNKTILFYKDPELNFPIKNLTGKQIYMMKGSIDPFVNEKSWFDSVAFIEKAGGNVTNDYIHDFQHMWANSLPVDPVWNVEASCAVNSVDNSANPLELPFDPPYKSGSNNCGWNLAYNLLDHLLSTTHTPLVERYLNHSDKGDFHAFNQTKFTENFPGANLDEIGYIYIPHSCKEGKFCKSLFLFHGLMGGAAIWKDTELRRLGLIEYAASNNIILVFPQSNDTMEFTMMGQPYPMKYGWNGGNVYNNETHPQIQAIQYMYHSLVLGADSNHDLAHLSHYELGAYALGQKDALAEEEEYERLMMSLAKDKKKKNKGKKNNKKHNKQAVQEVAIKDKKKEDEEDLDILFI